MIGGEWVRPFITRPTTKVKVKIRKIKIENDITEININIL